jgi:type I restriction enzyme S subunit
MKEGWEIKRLGDLCELITKGTTPTSIGYKFTDKGINFIKVESLTESGEIIPNKVAYVDEECHNALKRSQLKINDILFSIAGALGRIGIVNTEIVPANTNQALAIIRLREDAEVLVKYLAKYFNSDSITQEIEKLRGGAAQQNLSLGQLNNLVIPLPPLPEQQRIVSILDKCFSAIERSRNNAEQNLKNAKELFESYLQGVFEKKGDGWEEKALGEIADVEYGYTDKSTEEGDFRYVRITDIDNNGELHSTGKKFIKHSKEASSFLINNNDLLMARTGATFAKVLLYKDYEPSVFASYLIRIKFKTQIDNELYWYFTKTKTYWGQANALSSGAAQPHFNGAALKQVVFAYPKNFDEQKVLIKKFKSLSTETQKMEAIYLKKIADLDELKKSVLQKAFAGELKVSELGWVGLKDDKIKMNTK